MKPTTSYLLILLIFITFGKALGQKEEAPRDSIYYRATENLELYILSADYHMLTKDDRLQSILREFQQNLGEIEAKVPTTAAYTIDYRYQTSIEILQGNRIAGFSINGDKVIEDFRNEAILSDPGSSYRVTIRFNDLETLRNANFVSMLGEIIAALPEKDRYLRYLEFRPESQVGKAKLVENRPSGYLDMLSLQAGVGANVYRGKFLTDLTGEIGLHLNHKGLLRNQFYVSNNLMFSFNAENAAILNNFTSFGYRRNFSNQRDKPNWLGLEIGTLTKRNGDIFQPNTMRLGMNWQAGKHITVSPQLYFNGFFKDVSPGFRVGIGL